MSQQAIIQTMTLPDGREISMETGRLAKQADGSVVVKMGNTMLLATIVSVKEAKEDVDFLPLMVDYREKFSSIGRFPGGFLKRESKPSDAEVLISRLVDRALRPLFPDDYHADTILQISLISAEENVLPDALACLAASAAVAVSDIPFNGPTSEVRVARLNGSWVINPNLDVLADADIDLMVAGTMDSIVMVEGEMKEVSEEEMLQAIEEAHKTIKAQCQAQLDLAAKVGKAKREYDHERKDEELKEKIQAFAYDKCYAIAKEGINDKHLRSDKFKAVKEAFIAELGEEEAAEKAYLLGQYFGKVQKEAVRDCVLNERVRLDGRDMNQVRAIWSEIDYLPGAHGSSIFTRGETQSLTSVTLGSKMDEQRIDGAVIVDSDKFILHYNFPSFSTGEARPNRGPGRREVGHGNLAMRALKPMVPKGEENPYTIRVVSDILESNGSSSMATVCAGSLALMDAGVKMKKAVSGIAMGLISKGDKYAVLSDILGDEDHLGDMDFKVAGTTEGVTALQMDIKIEGITKEIMQIALKQAKEARLHILGVMDSALGGHREEMSEFAPRIYTLKIDQDKIRDVIGKGGAMIRSITEESDTNIEIEDDGTVKIFATERAKAEIAIAKIEQVTAEIEVGKTYNGKVTHIVDFGAFVEVLPGKEGLVHISQIAHERVNKVTDYLSEGQMVDVKVMEIDRQNRVRLSIKELLEKPAKPESSDDA